MFFPGDRDLSSQSKAEPEVKIIKREAAPPEKGKHSDVRERGDQKDRRPSFSREEERRPRHAESRGQDGKERKRKGESSDDSGEDERGRKSAKQASSPLKRRKMSLPFQDHH